VSVCVSRHKNGTQKWDTTGTQEGHKRDTCATQEGHKRDTKMGHNWDTTRTQVINLIIFNKVAKRA